MAAKQARAKAKADKQRKQKQEQAKKAHEDSIRIASFTIAQRDSLRRDSVVRDSAARVKAAADKAKKKCVSKGAPISHKQFLDWTDVTTSRAESIVENLFGESIQIHQDYLLGDVMRSRPIIVNYRYAINYVVEGVIAFFFILGIWAGRRSRFLWLVMSYFALDMVLHVGLGFGINEVYIMSAHWIYAIPIATAYLLKAAKPRHTSLLLKGMIAVLAIFLWIWNVNLIVQYLYF